jgi:hypothetical protein
MKKVEIPRKELYSMETDTAAVIYLKILNAGFDMKKPIFQNEDLENDMMVYSQEDDNATEAAG